MPASLCVVLCVCGVQLLPASEWSFVDGYVGALSGVWDDTRLCVVSLGLACLDASCCGVFVVCGCGV